MVGVHVIPLFLRHLPGEEKIGRDNAHEDNGGADGAPGGSHIRAVWDTGGQAEGLPEGVAEVLPGVAASRAVQGVLGGHIAAQPDQACRAEGIEKQLGAKRKADDTQGAQAEQAGNQPKPDMLPPGKRQEKREYAQQQIQQKPQVHDHIVQQHVHAPPPP